MKLLSQITFLLLIIIACGRPTTSSHCNDTTFNLVCKMLYHENEAPVVPEQDTKELDQLKAELKAQEARILTLELLDYSNDFASIDALVNNLMAEIMTIQNSIIRLDLSDSQFTQIISTLNSQITNITNQLVTIFNSQVVGVIDLCNNHKEVLVQLGDGKLLSVYIAKGKNHSLQILETGTYTSHDGEKCTFVVDQNGDVTFPPKRGHRD